MESNKEKTIAYYNNNAEQFIASSIGADMSENCDLFLSYLPQKARILDLGCGSGRDSRYFLEKGFEVFPVDGSEKMCEAASSYIGINAHCIKFDEVDFSDEFDGVWACASLLHVNRDELPGVLKKVKLSLKTHGILYMSFKYGDKCEERGGRFFTDLKQTDVSMLCNSDTGFNPLLVFITNDVRSDHACEKWLNIIAEKV